MSLPKKFSWNIIQMIKDCAEYDTSHEAVASNYTPGKTGNPENFTKLTEAQEDFADFGVYFFSIIAIFWAGWNLNLLRLMIFT